MIKDIAVYLDGSAGDAARLDYASFLGDRFEAHITGLYAHPLPQMALSADISGLAAQASQDLIDAAEQEAALAARRLDEALARTGRPADLETLALFEAEIIALATQRARTSDLFVCSAGTMEGADSRLVREGVLFGSGRASLMVPPGSARTTLTHAVVAWKNTRESARAVGEALGLLKLAGAVTVVIAEEQGAPEERREISGDDIGRYLGRHGISAEIRMLNGWQNAGAAILNEAGALDADLLVMGAYGHSRFREWALGGATRHVIENARLPVLMAH